MAWATPIIHAVGDILTASDWNITSNDLSFLGDLQTAFVGTTESTTSSTFTNLATVGPSVTLVTGSGAIVTLGALLGNNSAGGSALMGFTISGATTTAASALAALRIGNGASGASNSIQASFVVGIGTTAGTNTFTAQYEQTGGGTATFSARQITVQPLP